MIEASAKGWDFLVTEYRSDNVKIPLEDIRALPLSTGKALFWDPYVKHWGSRSSDRAKSPRIAYAAVLQGSDCPLSELMTMDVPSEFNFPTRLSYICANVYKYDYPRFYKHPSLKKEHQPFLDFLWEPVKMFQNIKRHH